MIHRQNKTLPLAAFALVCASFAAAQLYAQQNAAPGDNEEPPKAAARRLFELEASNESYDQITLKDGNVLKVRPLRLTG